jgi:hypothetical protein
MLLSNKHYFTQVSYFYSSYVNPQTRAGELHEIIQRTLWNFAPAFRCISWCCARACIRTFSFRIRCTPHCTLLLSLYHRNYSWFRELPLPWAAVLRHSLVSADYCTLRPTRQEGSKGRYNYYFEWQILFLRSGNLTLCLLTSYIYGAPCNAKNFNVVYIWTYVWQRWKPSLSICYTMCQHWIIAESFPVSRLCVNTLPATKITLITNGI